MPWCTKRAFQHSQAREEQYKQQEWCSEEGQVCK